MATVDDNRLDDEVVVTFDLTPEEWVEVAAEHNRASPLMKRSIRQSQVLMGVIVVAFTLLAFLTGEGLLSLTIPLVGIPFIAMLPRFLDFAHRRQYQRFANDGIATGTFGTHRVKLTAEGMIDETDAYQWLTRWHAIDRVVDGAGSFMIYTGKNAFLPIPHSAFRDSASLRSFSDRFYGYLNAAPAAADSLPPEHPADTEAMPRTPHGEN